MICDFLTLDEVKELSSSSYSDALTMKIYDSTVDFITQNLGHAFGLGLRVWHDGTGAVTATFVYTITVTATGIRLSTLGPASTVTLTFADYPTLREMVHAIQSLTGGTDNVLSGWEATVAYEKYSELSSSYLATAVARQAAIAAGNTGYAYRKLLCLDTFCETLSGNGESRIFLRMPVAAFVSVTEDGTALTDGSDYWAKRSLGVLIRMGCAGSTYCAYGTDCWSVRAPNNITVVYIPTWFSIRPAAMAMAIKALMALAIAAGAYQSEKIGDYSYVMDGGHSIAIWLQTLDSYMTPLSIF